MSVEAKVIAITGASAGLGAGMARWFGERGARLGLCARRVPEAPNDQTVSRSADVTDLESVRAFASDVGEILGPIDLWINNAAELGPIVPQRDLELSALQAHVQVNLGGVLNGTRAYVEHLEAAGHKGNLVNITSGLGQRGMAGVSAYSAAKAGVDRLTETIALEEPDLFEQVLAISPGVVETDMQRTLRTQDRDVLHELDMFRSRKAEGTMNSPGWVAKHIAGWVFGGVPNQGTLARVPQER
ncbi:MAG: SDR family NAD(P)-dependent oxidoreductase [Acidimicrobiia bacterium]|nr:SDR family NAD(P)-dependent oxidoreductase [Acidimicrobiia bacterium]